jgi:aspartyl-tRNA(Asn)/glutamyl-tRNA(Gln) amidotransferase subunit C
MKIDDLQETARLAHLNLGEDELAASFPAFEQMLGFFSAMQAADEDTGAFTVHIAASAIPVGIADTGDSPTVGADFFRRDVPAVNNVPNTASHNPEDRNIPNLLNNAGERDGRFIVVPNVL